MVKENGRSDKVKVKPNSFESAMISKTDTGLSFDLYIFSFTGKTRKLIDEPQILVKASKDLIPISIQKEPKILSDKYEAKDFNEIVNYIKTHYNVLFEHWNGKITDKEALNKLNK